MSDKPTKDTVNKVVLAYSGGLDTSVILRWLQDEYQCEVVTFTANLGQGEELEPARKKAEMLGVKEIFIEDLREEFVRDYVFPMFRANTVYEGTYLLGTSLARPLLAKRQIELARQTGAHAQLLESHLFTTILRWYTQGSTLVVEMRNGTSLRYGCEDPATAEAISERMSNPPTAGCRSPIGEAVEC